MKSPPMKGIACAMTLAMALAPCPTLAEDASTSDAGIASSETSSAATLTKKSNFGKASAPAQDSRDSAMSSTASPSTESPSGTGSDSTVKPSTSETTTDPNGSKSDEADTKDATAEEKAADGIPILSGGSWQKTDAGKMQYMLKDGTLAKDGLFEIVGKRYLFSKDGIAQTGWQTIEYQGKQRKFHFQDTGAADMGLKAISGAIYCFDEKTAVMLTGWQTVEGNTYLFGESGAALRGWQKVNGTWYRLDDSTRILKKGWLDEGGSRYWLDEETGATAEGRATAQGSKYWFDAQGHMKTSWVKVGGIWYYFYGSGAMATGWLQLGNDWYYLDDSGAMCTDYFKVGDWWYYAYSSGVVMYEDVTWDSVWGEYVIVGSDWHAHTYTGTVLDITGCSVYDMLYQLSLGHPVIVWTFYKFYPSTRLIYWWGSYKTNNHVMLLRGFNSKTNTFYVADPYIDGMEWISWNTFMNSWTVLRGAVAVW